MDEARTPPRTPPRTAGRLLLFVVVSLLTRAPFLRVPFLDLDEAAALVGARVVLGGGTLYVDFADNRPPLLYAFYALGQALFGGMAGVRLLAALAVLPLTAFAASAFYRHDRKGLLAGLLYLVYGASFLAHDMHSVSPELLMLLPLAWALVLVRDEASASRPGPLLGAGLLVGAAVLLRQQAGVALPALAWVSWRAGRDRGAPSGEAAESGAPAPTGSTPLSRLLRIAALGLGFALPLAATGAAFAARGAARELAYWTFLHNVGYAANPITLREALERAASYLLPFLLVTAPLLWAAARAREAIGSHHRLRLLQGLLLFSLPVVFVGFRFFPHYFVQLYLPLALLAAPWTAAALGPPLTGHGRFAAAWALAMLVAFTAANAFLYSGRARVYEETRPVFEDVARRLRADRCFGAGPLFVWGFAPQLYAQSGLPLASRFVVPQASLAGYVPGNRGSRRRGQEQRGLVRADHWDLLMDDLARRPPAFVLDTAPSGLHGWGCCPLTEFPRLDAWLRQGYDAVAIVDGVWVWRRRGCEVAPDGARTGAAATWPAGSPPTTPGCPRRESTGRPRPSP